MTARRAPACIRGHARTCRGGRCHLAGGAVVLCVRHAAALVSGGAR